MPAGRPTKYDPKYVEKVYKLALLGATDTEIASFFEVTPQTLYNWDEIHPEFFESRARGKMEADLDVVVSLRQRAIGYSHKAVKIFMPAGASEPVYANYIEHYPPDTQAASLWLRNRQPDKWKEKTEQTVTGDLNLHRVISEGPMKEEEWAAAHAAPEIPEATNDAD